jgi:hypothetical protein
MANENLNPIILKSALLCATGKTSDGNNCAALFDMGGQPLIAHQISQLQQLGVERFFIEVEELPGALVALTESLRFDGVSVTYVRSPKELSGILSGDELLLVMCDGIIADNGLLKEIISTPSRYIVTLDGRDENNAFERIDLNSFWAGIALLDTKSVSAIAALPEGWSIRSSLLRQALQDAVPHRPLNQELLLAKHLRLVKTNAEAEQLGRETLRLNASKVSGFFESKLFGPIAAALAPRIRRSSFAKSVLQFSIPLLSVLSLAAALSGFAPIAVIVALMAMLLFQTSNLLQYNEKKPYMSKIYTVANWSFLACAFVFMAWKDAAQPYFAVFPPLVALGLLLLARKLPIAGWRKALLASPAFLAIAAFLFSVIDQIVIGIEFVAIVQLAGLIFPLSFHDKVQQA